MQDQTGRLNTMVKDIMSKNIVFLKENDTLELVFTMFNRCHISAAPVMNMQGDIVGVITKSDLMSPKVMEHIVAGGSLQDIRAHDIMSAVQPVFVEERSSAHDVVKILADYKIQRVFVKSRTSEIIGMVAAFDIVKLLGSRKNKDNSTGTDMKGIHNIVSKKHYEVINRRSRR